MQPIKKLSVTELKEMIDKAIQKVTNEAVEDTDVPQVDYDLLKKVSDAMDMVSQDDPNSIGTMSRYVRDNQNDPAYVGEVFLDMMTSDTGVSPIDGKTPRMAPEDFAGIDKIELGKAVIEQFSK